MVSLEDWEFGGNCEKNAQIRKKKWSVNLIKWNRHNNHEDTQEDISHRTGERKLEQD